MNEPKWLLDIDDATRELAHGTVVELIQALLGTKGGSWAPHEDGEAIVLNTGIDPGYLPRLCQLHIIDNEFTAETISDPEADEEDSDRCFLFSGAVIDGGAHDVEGRALSTLRAWEAALSQPIEDDARQIDMLRKEAMRLALGAAEALRINWHSIAVWFGVDGKHRLTVMTKSYSLLEFTPEGGRGTAGRMSAGLSAKYDGIARCLVRQHVDEDFAHAKLNLEIASCLAASLTGPVDPVERMAAVAALPKDCHLSLP